MVELNGERWIADVGFGGQTLTAPIRLIANEEQETPHGPYRLLSEGNDWILQFRHHEHWQSMYHFDLGDPVLQRLRDGKLLVGALAAIPFPSSPADVSPPAGRGQANADQL